MKNYKVYPIFAFDVEAEDEIEANEKAYELMKEMRNIVWFDFDFEIEEDN